MKKSVLRYKGYYSKPEFSPEDKVFHGKIEGITDLVTYESSSAENLKFEFEAAIDDYLETCDIVGKLPDKPLNEILENYSAPGSEMDLSENYVVPSVDSSFQSRYSFDIVTSNRFNSFDGSVYQSEYSDISQKAILSSCCYDIMQEHSPHAA